MLRGGASGPVVVPKDPVKSLLIKAIEHQDPNLAMPPKSAGGKLSAGEIKELSRWVRMGAPDPRKEEDHLVAKEQINESAKSWWSYLPLSEPLVPVEDSWAWTTIDRFIAQKHRESNVHPVADAQPEALLRRLYFDLTGLPPSIDQVRSFAEDLGQGLTRQESIERVVDQLLESGSIKTDQIAGKRSPYHRLAIESHHSGQESLKFGGLGGLQDAFPCWDDRRDATSAPCADSSTAETTRTCSRHSAPWTP
jgi:hypothetical protein